MTEHQTEGTQRRLDDLKMEGLGPGTCGGRRTFDTVDTGMAPLGPHLEATCGRLKGHGGSHRTEAGATADDSSWNWSVRAQWVGG